MVFLSPAYLYRQSPPPTPIPLPSFFTYGNQHNYIASQVTFMHCIYAIRRVFYTDKICVEQSCSPPPPA